MRFGKDDNMPAVAEKLRAELDRLEKETKDEEIQKEILKIDIKLQRGSMKGRADTGPLTYEEKEEAFNELLREKGLKWPGSSD
ncbi:hypothetical protein [Candidatus Pyrohabitans sp.]